MIAKYVFLYVPTKFTKRHVAVAWFKSKHSEIRIERWRWKIKLLLSLEVWKAAKQLSWAFILDPLIRNSFRMLVSSLFHWYQCVCLLQHLATLVYRLRLIETAFFCIVWQWSHFWDMWREITTVNYLMAFLFCFVEFISSMLIFCVSYWVRNCDGWL